MRRCQLNLTQSSQQNLLFSILMCISCFCFSQITLADAQQTPFAKLIGNWSIQDYAKDKNGQWQPAGGADWNFYWILDGAAIQDDWIAPSLTKPAPKSGRQLGTNIRIFNPKTQQWEMTWASNTGKKLEHFSAKNIGDTVVMQGNYQGQPTKITFFNIQKEKFSWKMERPILDQNNQPTEQWRIIYKIEGTRVK